MRSNSGKSPENSYKLKRELEDLKDGILELSIELTSQQLSTFKEYLRSLYNAQGRIHLISHQDTQRIAKRHLLPSLMVRTFLFGTRVCDIGSGAGFPGIPLAIADHRLHVVLFESIGKKAEFLKDVRNTLDLDTIEIIHERAELYEGESFDTVLLRAVGAIKKNLKMIDHLLAPGGRAIFYKTHRVEQELRHAQSPMQRLGFTAEVQKLYTPLERRPLAFVVLERK